MSSICVSFSYFLLYILFDCCAIKFFWHVFTQQFLKEARIQVMCFPISFTGNKNHFPFSSRWTYIHSHTDSTK